MIGIDIVEVERLPKSGEFLNKIASKEEVDFINAVNNSSLREQRLAALWAVKEAVMKALGLGALSGVSFKDIKLEHEESGRPFVELAGVAKQEMTASFYGKKIEVSISHTKSTAVAVAIII